MNRYLNSFICFLILLVLINIQEIFSSVTLFIIYTSLLIIYLLIEIILIRNSDRRGWLLNPAVLASLFTFILSFGITNYVYLSEENIFTVQLFDRLGLEAFLYLNNAMPLVFIGAIAMWAGFHSGLGQHLFQFMTVALIQVKKYLRKSFEIRFKLILVLAVISVFARILAIYLGIFGYAQDPNARIIYSSLDIPLNMLGDLGKFCLLIISLAYFGLENNKKFKRTFITILIIELLFGILSGMKIGLMLPFIIPIIAYYIINKRLKKIFVLYFFTSVFVAYAIIEPFRVLRDFDPNFKSTPGYILSTFTEAYSLSQAIGFAKSEFSENVLLSAFMRSNYIIEIAKAKEYDDKVGLKEGDPDFKGFLFTAPLLAYVPRALWSGKPDQRIGNWFTKEVWGWDIESSTGMTPFGFLYFAGGIPYIIIFLFIIGIMQDTLYKFYNLGAGGLIVYLGLLSTVVLIDSTVNGIFISWLRLFPILIILQYFIFKK